MRRLKRLKGLEGLERLERKQAAGHTKLQTPNFILYPLSFILN
jgi:hypothetical protein